MVVVVAVLFFVTEGLAAVLELGLCLQGSKGLGLAATAGRQRVRIFQSSLHGSSSASYGTIWRHAAAMDLLRDGCATNLVSRAL